MPNKAEIIQAENNQVTNVTNIAAPHSVLAIIERAALNPDVDVFKMEKLLEMSERITAKASETAFYSAMAKMQCEIPIINEDGLIKVYSQKTNKTHETSYSTLENILDVVKPIMQKHGFAILFKTGSTDKNITVTGILTHEQGHKIETEITLPFDATGSKNAVQAIGSSTSYGKRYVLCALLNIATKNEDDDGVSAMRKVNVNKYINKIANAKTLDDLTKIWEEAAKETSQLNDLAANTQIKQTLADKKKEIQASVKEAS